MFSFATFGFDEVRAIMESRGRLYTQIKIDEITNLGAVTIRLRSLIGALEYAKSAASPAKAPVEGGVTHA